MNRYADTMLLDLSMALVYIVLLRLKNWKTTENRKPGFLPRVCNAISKLREHIHGPLSIRYYDQRKIGKEVSGLYVTHKRTNRPSMYLHTKGL